MGKLSARDLRFIGQLVEHPRGPGYVLDFSDSSFADFFRIEIGIDIDENQWSREGGSKGKRLRCILQSSDDRLVLKVLNLIWQYRKEMLQDRNEADPVVNGRERIKEIAKKVGYQPKTFKSAQKATSQAAGNLIGPNADGLKQQLLDLVTLQPQTRGFAFERFLHELLDKSGHDPRSSFRNTGEQIDGSFSHRGEVYLLEAKWTGPKISIGDLHTFEGKVGSKAEWARGLFVSYSGFTDDAFTAFGSQKRIVCMDGSDLYALLDQSIPFAKVLDLKVRRAVETGRPFVPLRELNHVL